MKLDHTMDEVDMIMLAVDKNKNGVITLEEFAKALKDNA